MRGIACTAAVLGVLVPAPAARAQGGQLMTDGMRGYFCGTDICTVGEVCDYVGFSGTCRGGGESGEVPACVSDSHRIEPFCCFEPGTCVDDEGRTGTCVAVEGADGLHVCVTTTPGGMTFCTDADPIPVDAVERCRDATFGGPPFDWGHGDCDADGIVNQDDEEPCTPAVALDAGVDAGPSGEDAGRSRPPALASSFNGAGGCRCEVGAPRPTPAPAQMTAVALTLALLFARLRRVSSRRAASRCSPPERS